MSARVIRPVFLLTGVLFFSVSIGSSVYKWVDENGIVNYSETPPKVGNAHKLVTKPLSTYIPPAPGYRSVAGAVEASKIGHEEVYARPSLPLRELNKLPENEISEYLETLSSGFLFDTDSRSPRYHLRLKKTEKLTYGAVSDINFENPLDQNDPVVSTERWPMGKSEISVTSPPLTGLKCANYPVEISIYSSIDGKRLLGTHKQHVQSRVNLEKIKTTEELLKAMANGSCP